MGRSRDSCRAEFTLTHVQGRVYGRATCKHCEKEMADSASKLKEHLSSCTAYSSRETLVQTELPLVRRTEDGFSLMSKSTQKRVEDALADWIFTAGLPLATVDSVQLKRFCTLLNPAFKMPSRYCLSNELLDSKHAAAVQRVTEAIQGSSSLTLMVDGWTTVTNEPVLSFVVAQPKPYLYKVLHTGTQSHSGETIAAQCAAIIDEIGVDKVAAIVTDNCAAMKCAWRRLNITHPSIVTFGCCAHIVNLLIKDIFRIGGPNEALARATEINSFFNQSSLCDMVLKSKREELGIENGLKDPVSTRWASQISLLQSIVVNKPCLQQVAVDVRVSSRLGQELRQQILSDVLYEQCLRYAALLSPLKDLILQMEGDSAGLATAFKGFCHWRLVLYDKVIT